MLTGTAKTKAMVIKRWLTVPVDNWPTEENLTSREVAAFEAGMEAGKVEGRNTERRYERQKR